MGPALLSHERSLRKEAKQVCAVTATRGDRGPCVTFAPRAATGSPTAFVTPRACCRPPSCFVCRLFLCGVGPRSRDVVERIVGLAGGP